MEFVTKTWYNIHTYILYIVKITRFSFLSSLCLLLSIVYMSISSIY